MPLINYQDIYKRALVRINDLGLARLQQEDFYDKLLLWMHSASATPYFRKKFSTFSLNDELMILNFELNNSVDESYDKNFVTDILAKGIIINYFPAKLETDEHLAVMIGGKEEKKLLDNYSGKRERLKTLETEFYRELTQHGYYFNSGAEN